MNLIQTVQTDIEYSWTSSLTVGGKKIPLEFRVFGGTFKDGTTTQTITPDAAGMFKLELTAKPPSDDSSVHHCIVHWNDDGLWTTLQQASRNLVRTVKNRIDWRVQTQGFDAFPIGTQASGLMVSVGQPVSDAVTGDLKLIESLPTGAYDFDAPMTIVLDRKGEKCYIINDIHDETKARVVKTFSGKFAHVMTRYSPTTYMREVVLFYSNGRIETYNSQLVFVTAVSHPAPINRVVHRKRVGDVPASYIILDARGYANYYDARMKLDSSDGTRFWVDASDSFDALIDVQGKLSTDATDAYPDIFFYQFSVDSPIVYGYEKNVHTTYYKLNLLDGSVTKKSALPHEFVLTHRNASALSQVGGISTLGTETNIDGDQLFMALTSNPYQDVPQERALGYFVKDVPDLKHITEPDFTSDLPDFDVELGEIVTTTFDVKNTDPDISLPITLPDGIEWTAKVGGQPTKYVKAGQRVTLTMKAQEITNSPFPISIGRDSSLIEMIPDSMPDPFSWLSVHDQPEDFWYTTEKQKITGINVRVPLTAMVGGETDYSKIKIFVNSVETPMPVYIFNNDLVHFEVWHGKFQTKVRVNIGDGSTEFGIYTVDEIPIPQLTNWCYVAAGTEVISDEIVNDSPADLDLTITSGNAEFIQGGTHLKLSAGQTTKIKHIAAPNTKGKVDFRTINATYEWHIWSHDTWLDPVPAEVRTQSMELTKSSAIEFASIPEDFMTKVRVPAGVNFYIGHALQEQDLDSRGVSSDSHGYTIKVQDLFIEAYPRTMTHDLVLGDATMSWSLLYIADPALEVGKIKAPSFLRKFVKAWTETVQKVDRKIIQVKESAVKFLRLQYSEAMSKIGAFALTTTNKVLGHKRFDLKQHSDMMQIKTFKMTKSTGIQIVIKHKQKPEPSLITDNISLFELDLTARYVLPPHIWGVDPYGAQYRTYSNNWTDENQIPIYIPTSHYLSDVVQEGKYVKSGSNYQPDNIQTGKYTEFNRYTVEAGKAKNAYNFWYYVGREQAARLIVPTDNRVYVDVRHYVPFDIYQIGLGYDRGTWTPPYYIEREPRWIRGSNLPIFKVKMEAFVHQVTNTYYLHSEWRNIQGYAAQVDLNDSWVRYIQNYLYRVDANGARNVDANWNYYVGDESNARYATGTSHMVDNDREAVYVDRSLIGRGDASVPQKIGSVSIMLPDLPSDARNVKDEVLLIQQSQKRTTPTNVVTRVLRKFKVEMSDMDEGETDPLKQGYFATELDALTDAIQKWKHDPTSVKAVQRDDGTWYWIRVIPCDNSCGAYSCDTRGYLSGG